MMVERMTAGKPLPVAVMQEEIVSQKQMVHCSFVEEYDQSGDGIGTAAGAGRALRTDESLNALAIPSSLQ